MEYWTSVGWVRWTLECWNSVGWIFGPKMKIWNSVINQNLNEIRVTKLCLHCTKKIIGRIVYWLFDRFDLKIMKIFRSLGASTSFQFCCFTNNRFIVTSVDLGTVHYRTSRNSATAKNRSLFLLLEFFHNSILVLSISVVIYFFLITKK